MELLNICGALKTQIYWLQGGLCIEKFRAEFLESAAEGDIQGRPLCKAKQPGL